MRGCNGATREAGIPGITGQDCIRNRGACFDNTIPNVPWCFQLPPQ
jgi:hypothetical protein